LDPVVLIDRRHAALQFGEFYNLVVIQPGGFSHKLAVAFVGEAQNDFCIGITDYRHIKQARCLVGDDKAFAIGTHLGDSVCEHFNRLAKQV
jgi:hypothetical protein